MSGVLFLKKKKKRFSCAFRSGTMFPKIVKISVGKEPFPVSGVTGKEAYQYQSCGAEGSHILRFSSHEEDELTLDSHAEFLIKLKEVNL